MLSAIALFRIVAASQILLSGLVLWRAGGPRVTRGFALALLLCICAYLILPPIARGLDVQGAAVLPLMLLLEAGANAIPGLLALFAWHLFRDDNQPAPWQMWVLIGLYMSALLPRHLLDLAPGGTLHGLVYDAPQIIKLLLTLWAMVLAWRGREADLLNSRLLFRYYFCAGLGVAVVVVVIAELAARFNVPASIELLGMAAICAAAFAANVWLLRPGRNLSFEEVAAAPPPQVSQPLVDKVLAVMESQRFYAREDLKIGLLAEEVGVPEHVLRRTINGTLKQRNFNQFVNQYRIREAAQRLLANPDEAVLTIALDVGFRSLSSFNAAFRQTHGVAPTTYRENNAKAGPAA